MTTTKKVSKVQKNEVTPVVETISKLDDVSKEIKNAINAPTSTSSTKKLERKLPVAKLAEKPLTKDLDVEFKSLVDTVKSELGKVENSFTKIAYALHGIKTGEFYKLADCKNIYDYAKQEFNISRGTCSNFLNVVEHFNARDEAGHLIDKLSPKFEGYNSAQLIVMLSLSDEQLEKVTSNMSSREIKKLKKESDSADSAKSSSARTSSDSEKETIDIENKEVNRNVLISFKDLKDYQSKIDKMDDLIMLALKNGKYTIEIHQV